jgi:hypothetical protein
MHSGEGSSPTDNLSRTIDDVARRARRFWLPRGTDPDLSDNGFLVDPESPRLMYAPASAVQLEALATFPVLGLLGEPGMGKTTVLDQEAWRLKITSEENTGQLLRVDLAACGTDLLVFQRIFKSKMMKSWKTSNARLHLLLDGFDTCLHFVETLVALLLDGLNEQPRDRLSLRIACRTADWPSDLETGLEKLWPTDEQAVRIYELAPLRKEDAYAAAEAIGLSATAFLGEVASRGAAQFANRPITLGFLLKTLQSGKGLPQRRTDLYREGCRVLCDEWRPDLRRASRPQKLTSGMRFSVAGRLAAVSIFSRTAALWTGPRRDIAPQGDVRIDELLRGEEHIEGESREVGEDVIAETLRSSLFRSVAPNRIVFSHQTYAEFLAAQYLVDHNLGVPEILRLLLHPDRSGKVVPQLRETAAWLAALVPEVGSRILETDPATLLACDTPPTSEEDRRTLVRQILTLFDNGDLFDVKIIAAAGKHEDGARIKFTGIAEDLKPYVIDKSKPRIARHAAILIAQYTQLADLDDDLLRTALDDEEPQDLRVAAAVALRVIGSESSKAALKPLVSISPLNDPGDELKGAGLAAVWPKHLSAQELFEALTPPRKRTGEYQRFLASEFAVHLRSADMIQALQWARGHATKARAELDPLGRGALRVMIAAIDCFRDIRVREYVAEVLVQIALKPAPALQLMIKLSSHREARIAIALVAIRVAPDVSSMWHLKAYGLVHDSDVPILLAELDIAPPRHVQEKIGVLIANILHWSRSFDMELMEQIHSAAQANPVLSAALKPVLDPVDLGSDEAKRQKEFYEGRQRQNDPEPEPELAPNPEDLIGVIDSNSVVAFIDICWRLAGSDWYANEEVLPGWARLQPAMQDQIIRSAEMYLSGYCVASTSWIETGEIWYNVTCGYWALRLLAQVAPDALDSLSDDVWQAWIPSVFGDSYTRQVPDDVHTAILKIAYQRAPNRFREVVSRFIDSQNNRSVEVSILDRVAPVWDCEIAKLLHTKLDDRTLKPHTFRSVLDTLMKAGDPPARIFATELVAGVKNARPETIGRVVDAALELLDDDPAGGWQIVWPVAKANHPMAEDVLAELALDPHSFATTRILKGLHENDLAALQTWLLEHQAQREGGAEAAEEGRGVWPFALSTSNDRWSWLRVAVFDTLLQRGTPAASEAIRKLKEAFPNENLDHAVKVSEELTRQNTWKPLPPRELLDLVLTSSPSRKVESSSSSSDSPPASMPVAAPAEAANQQQKLGSSGSPPMPVAIPVERANQRKKVASSEAPQAATPLGVAEEANNEQQRVAKNRAEWLDRQLSCHPEWSSDLDIEKNGGPTYNTIRRFRSGKKSTRERYVRSKLATALATNILEVPE